MFSPQNRYPFLKKSLLLISTLAIILSWAAGGHAFDFPKEILDMSLQTPVLQTTNLDEYTDINRSFNMNLGIARTPGGRLWATWISGGDDERAYLVLADSDDEGQTWSQPRLVIDPPDAPNGIARVTKIGNLWTDPLGRLWLFFDQMMGSFDSRGGVWYTICENPDVAWTENSGPTWSTPKRLWNGSLLNKPFVMKDGTWALPLVLKKRGYLQYGFIFDPTGEKAGESTPEWREAWKEIHHDLDPVRGSYLVTSSDQGKTWERRGMLDFPYGGGDEHMIVERRDGELWMIARSPVQTGILHTTSQDGGRTWAEAQKWLPHRSSRFYIGTLASGRVLLIRHGKLDEATATRCRMTAYLSDDDGRTWSDGFMIDEREGVSYPDVFQHPDGRIFVSYDYNRMTDAEILMAVFTEEDILQGQDVSGKVRLRQLINKAGRDIGTKADNRNRSLAPPRIEFNVPDKLLADQRGFQGIPSITVSDAGTLYATWYGGKIDEGGDNYVMTARSRDGGETWTFPLFVVQHDFPVRCFDPSMWTDPTGKVWLFWTQSYCLCDSRMGVWGMYTSNPDDDSPQWSEPVRITDGVMMNKPIADKAGRWILPVSCWFPGWDVLPWENEAHLEHARKAVPDVLRGFAGAQCVVSDDEGTTWKVLGQAFLKPENSCYFSTEHSIVQKRDDSLLALIRTRQKAAYSHSEDGGFTWSEPVETDFNHTSSRIFFRRLNNDDLILVKNGPWNKNTGRTSLWAFSSSDDGQTYPNQLLLDERADVSYPDGVQAKDGTIYVIYDRDRNGDREILLARFTKEDLAAGKTVSDKARLKIIVDRPSLNNP